MYDQVVRRFEGNASSEPLEIVERTVLGVLCPTEEQLAACDQVQSRTLPRVDSLPIRTLERVVDASLALGIDRSAALIRHSPSAGRLLALTTAPELEMDMQP